MAVTHCAGFQSAVSQVFPPAARCPRTSRSVLECACPLALWVGCEKPGAVRPRQSLGEAVVRSPVRGGIFVASRFIVSASPVGAAASGNRPLRRSLGIQWDALLQRGRAYGAVPLAARARRRWRTTAPGRCREARSCQRRSRKASHSLGTGVRPKLLGRRSVS